jgi:serine/threonine protein kinase
MEGNLHQLLDIDYFKGANPLSLDSTKAPQQHATRLLKHMLLAIEHLDKYGLQHGNIKPSNILYNTCVEGPGIYDYKLSDFSIARPDEHVDSQQLRSTFYMAPELARNQNRELHKTSDVFSLYMIMAVVLKVNNIHVHAEAERQKEIRRMPNAESWRRVTWKTNIGPADVRMSEEQRLQIIGDLGEIQGVDARMGLMDPETRIWAFTLREQLWYKLKVGCHSCELQDERNDARPHSLPTRTHQT